MKYSCVDEDGGVRIPFQFWWDAARRATHFSGSKYLTAATLKPTINPAFSTSPNHSHLAYIGWEEESQRAWVQHGTVLLDTYVLNLASPPPPNRRRRVRSHLAQGCAEELI